MRPSAKNRPRTVNSPELEIASNTACQAIDGLKFEWLSKGTAKMKSQDSISPPNLTLSLTPTAPRSSPLSPRSPQQLPGERLDELRDQGRAIAALRAERASDRRCRRSPPTGVLIPRVTHWRGRGLSDVIPGDETTLSSNGRGRSVPQIRAKSIEGGIQCSG